MSTETTDEKAPKKDVYADSFDPRYPEFTSVVGDLPFIQPNVRTGHEREDLLAHISSSTTNPTWNCVGCCLCALTGVGCCYLCCKMVLIDQGEYGFTLNNGRYEILTPGRHVLVSPLNSFTNQYSLGLQLIQEGPITIVRVPVGSYGFAFHNAKPEVLLPGVHVRNNAAFKFSSMQTTDQDVIQFGPVKFFTVQSGSVRCCFINGRIKIFKEGRYGVNCGTFVVGPQIDTTQENLRFEKHPVLLDGGISLLVEGLLTYQVSDVEKLLLQLGSKDLVRAIQDVTKAELARVFAGLHLEQISKVSDAKAPSRDPRADEKLDLDGGDEPSALLGKGAKAATAQHASAEGETRMWICSQVIKYITPLVASWGVRVINFQLESTKIADDNYAKEYEAASLAMAKAKASLRAVHAQNQIRLQTAKATAEAVQIEAEGKKNATIIEAQGNAEARIIEARARNEAAEMMTDPFSKEFAMAGQQVDFARNLKAQVLTVGADSGVAQIFTASAMLKNSGI